MLVYVNRATGRNADITAGDAPFLSMMKEIVSFVLPHESNNHVLCLAVRNRHAVACFDVCFKYGYANHCSQFFYNFKYVLILLGRDSFCFNISIPAVLLAVYKSSFTFFGLLMQQLTFQAMLSALSSVFSFMTVPSLSLISSNVLLKKIHTCFDFP